MSDQCRLCGQNYNVFELSDLTENQVIENVEFHCRVILENNKLLPQSACSNCLDILNEFKKFSENVKVIQETLKQSVLDQVQVDTLFFPDQIETEAEIEAETDDPKAEDTSKTEAIYPTEDKVDEQQVTVKTDTRIVTRSSSKRSSKAEQEPPKKTPRTQPRNKRNPLKYESENDFSADDSDTDPDFTVDNEIAQEPNDQEDDEMSEADEEIEDDLDDENTKQSNMIIRRNIPKITPQPCHDPIEKIFEEELLEMPNRFIQRLKIDEMHLNSDDSVKDSYISENAISTWKNVQYFCKICNKNFNSGFFKYKKHIETHKEIAPKRKFYCDTCKAFFHGYEEILNHYFTHNYYLKFDCIVCSKLFWKLTSLFKHYASEHPKTNENIFMCLICGEHTKSKDELKAHKTEFHDRKLRDFMEDPFNKQFEFECSKIPESYRNPDGTIKPEGHFIVGNFRWQDIETKCFDCDQVFTDMLEHKQHVENKHPKHKKQLRIYNCPYQDRDRTEFCCKKITKLIKHIGLQHYNHLKFCCLFCRDIFWNFEALDAHYKMEHPVQFNQNFILCLICGHYSLSFIDAQEHRLYHIDPTNDPKYENNCYFKSRQEKFDRNKRASVIMEEYFEDIIQKQEHMGALEVNEEEKEEDGLLTESAVTRLQLKRWNELFDYSCQECPSTFKSPYELQQHLKFIHTDTKQSSYLCKICDKKDMKKLAPYILHMVKHEPTLSFSCVICSKTYWSYLSLFHHYKNEHPRQRSIVICLICGEPVKEVCKLNSHIEAHKLPKVKPRKYVSRIPRVKCQYCDKSYKERKALQKHLLIHTNPEPPQEYICEICAKTFKSKCLLKNHRERHEEKTELFACDMEDCDFKTKHKYFLKYHKKTHSEERPFQCEICLQRFKSKVSVKRHKETHQEPQHQCEFCFKKFVKKYDLKVHVRLHTGDYPYNCPTCGQAYPSWGNMQKHSQSRHGIDLASERYKKRREQKSTETSQQQAHWENANMSSS